MRRSVLPLLLSAKSTRWTLWPSSRKHGLCSIGGAPTHAGELCTSSASAQPNGGKFPGNRSGHRLVCLLLRRGCFVQSLLAVRTESRGAPIPGRQFSRAELHDQFRYFSRFTRTCAECVDRRDDPRARSSTAAEGISSRGESELGARRRRSDCDARLRVGAGLLGRRWPPYTLQHPQLFSQRSLATLLQASGFEVIETIKTTNYFPLPFLMGAALTVFGLPERFVPAGDAPLVGLKLGNIGTVARNPRSEEHTSELQS